MRAQDGYLASNISATTGQFPLAGGRYALMASATWGGGSVTLDILGPDGTAWLVAATALIANGTALVDLPTGTYRFAVATATAVYASITRVPGE
jgi:hypothetical protein